MPDPCNKVIAYNSDEPNTHRLWSLTALDHIHGDPLPFRKAGEAAPSECRDMGENVLAAPVPDDEAEPLIWAVPLYRADLLDSGLVGGLTRSLRPCAPRRLLERGGRIDTQDLGDLQALLAWCGPDFKAGARRHGAVAAALDDAHVEKGITAGRQLDEAKALFGVIPFDRGLNRRACRGGLEPRAALTRRIPKTGRRRVVVIVEASPLGLGAQNAVGGFGEAWVGSMRSVFPIVWMTDALQGQ
jgi:hypothetical protein